MIKKPKMPDTQRRKEAKDPAAYKQLAHAIVYPLNIEKLDPNAKGLFRDEFPSLWNFHEHGVTSSFLNSFLTCREQTRLHYVEGWASRHVPLAFEFGTCCHWILEQAYSPDNIRKIKPMLETAFEQLPLWIQLQVDTYEKKWLEQVTLPSQKQLEQQELVYGMANAILPSYFTRWNGDFLGKYSYHNGTTAPVKWDSLEEVFEIPYEYPDGLVVPIRGRRDGVFYDKRNKLWVFDTKCRSVINDDDALDTLPFDLQQMLYLYVTRVQKEVNPAGVIMNILRRPGQRRGMDEALTDFLERIAAEYAKPAKFDHHYKRYEMAIDRNEISDWKADMLDPLMLDVRAWYEGTAPHYMNHNALITKYGKCGMFLPICKNEFSQCYRREHCFSELAEV